MSELAVTEQLIPPTNSTSWKLRDIQVAPGRTLKATPVFETYWRFAVRRQDIFMRRVLAQPPSQPIDPILATYRFTNAYRAADRVSQYLIRKVLYEGDQSPMEIFFRSLLFRLFNRIETWEHLSGRLGSLSSKTFDPERYSLVLDGLLEAGKTIYSPAYIMPCPPFDHARKHGNHLRLLDLMLQDDAPRRVQNADSLKDVYGILKGYPSIGPFLAFQLAIDLNYSTLLDFSEMDFVVAGPGACDGIRKCFADTGGLDYADVMHAVSDLSDSEFDRLGIRFRNLWGRRLHLVDIQNLFCEVDKYARVAHPLSPSISKRTRIKQRYSPNPKPLPQWYPPKWNLDLPPSIACKSGLDITP
ncbi:MAG: putative DNA base hypermodification protein [Gammaproteobacteria bacterium]|nr:putative DNA base hypermodification protein [Gammaproteobacteria bacterium]